MMSSQPEKRNLRQSLKQNTPRWILFWVIITANANLIGFRIVNLFPQFTQSNLAYYFSVVLDALFLGTFVGIFQWLLLKVRIPKIKAWIPATTLAYIIFLVGINLVLQQIHLHQSQLIQYWINLLEPLLSILAAVMYGNILYTDFIFLSGFIIFFGFSVGIAQWFLLRHKRKNAAWWILIHLLCTFFASLFGYRVGDSALSFTPFFIFYSIFSGIAMDVWFKIRTPQENSQTPSPIYQGSNNIID